MNVPQEIPRTAVITVSLSLVVHFTGVSGLLVQFGTMPLVIIAPPSFARSPTFAAGWSTALTLFES